MQIIDTKGVEFPNGMPQVMGSRKYNTMTMRTGNQRHFTRPGSPDNSERVSEGFADLLNQALARVEKLDVHSQKLSSKAVYDPDAVDVHDLVIAGEKARFALNLTKTLSDGFIRAYRELTNPR